MWMWYFVSQINLVFATHLPESLDSRMPQQSREHEKEGKEIEKGDKRTRENVADKGLHQLGLCSCLPPWLWWPA